MYEYNIDNLENGLLVMFRLKNPEESDYGCDVSMEFLFASTSSGPTWYLTRLKSSLFEDTSRNKMLINILEEVDKNDIVKSVNELIDFCNKIGTPNSDIFSYDYNVEDLCYWND